MHTERYQRLAANKLTGVIDADVFGKWLERQIAGPVTQQTVAWQPVPIVQQLGNWKRSSVLLEIYSEAQRVDLLNAVGQFPARSRAKAKATNKPRKPMR